MAFDSKVNVGASKTDRLPEINGLRGIAILMVLFIHLNFSLLYDSDWKPIVWSGGHLSMTWLMASLLRHCWIGVNCFFVLSGFVLFMPYVTNARQLVTGRDCLAFYIRRAWRLLPLLFVSTSVFLVLTYPTSHGRLELFHQLWRIMTGLFIFKPETFFPQVNGVLWSLGIEIWYSAIFPVVAILLLKPNYCKYVLTFFCVALIARLCGANMFLENWQNAFVNPVKDSILGRIDDFVAGMVVCLVYFRGNGMAFLSRPITGIVGFALLWGGSIAWDLSDLHILPRWVVAVVNIPTNVGFSCLLIYCLKAPASFFSRFLRFGTLQACGVMCYSIYVWHFNIQERIVPYPANYYQISSYLVFMFIIATSSWLLIENASAKEIKARLKKLVA